MPRDNILGVWLRGQRIGELERLRGGDLRLRFDPDMVNEYGAGTHLVSLSLPLTTKRVQGERLRLFVRGLLPEPPIRAAIETRACVPFDDDYALLAKIGGECAGALQFLPDEAQPDAGLLRLLSGDEVDRIVGDLPSIDTPDGLPVGASLGGVQAKVLLTETPEGWAWPAFGAMSSHLIKPQPQNGAGLPGLLETEHWTGSLATKIGLTAASSELRTFGDRQALVVRRYDRRDGYRYHQEDFTQALSLRPSDKYELGSTVPGRLRRIADLAGPLAADESEFLRDLLRMITFNLVIGNSDAHSKNYSLLLAQDGSVALAPLYDAAPVLLLDANYRYAGHAVDSQTRLPFVTRGHVVREAIGWGVAQDVAESIVTDLAERVASEPSDQSGLPDSLAGIPPLVARRAEQFLDGRVMQHVSLH